MTTTTEPGPDARERRRAALARQFIEVLEPLLEVENYSDVSVERLITAANISRSTFYVYFQDKGDLLSAVAGGVVVDLYESGSHWWSFPADGGWEELRQALRPAVEVYRRNRAILRSVIETASYDERVRREHSSLIDQVAAALARHLEAAQAAGAAVPGLDAPRTAAWLVWMFERGLYQLLGDASEAEAEEQLAALTTVVWRTLYEGYRS